MAHAPPAADGAAVAPLTPIGTSRASRFLARGRRTAATLAVLVVAGFVLRWSTTRIETLWSSDSCHYLRLAAGLAAGDGYRSDGSEHPDVTRLPVFPILVAATGSLTGNFEGAARGLVALAGALMPIPLFFLARRSFGPDAAWAAAVLGAFSCLHGVSGFLLPDPIALLLLLSTAASAVDASRRPSGTRFARTGVLAAAAALTRSEALLVAPVVALAVTACSRRRRLAGGSLVLLGALAVYAPYAAWTSWKLGRFAPSPGLEYVRDARLLSDRLDLRWVGEPSIPWSDKATFMLDRSGERRLLDVFFLDDRLPELAGAPGAPDAAPADADERPTLERRRDEALRRGRIVAGNLRRMPSQLRVEHLAPAVPWGLALLGAACGVLRRSSRRLLPVLLSPALCAVAPYYSHVEPRFGYAIFAGTVVFAAGGWGWLAGALRRVGTIPRSALHLLLLAGVVVPALFHDPRAGGISTRRLAQRDAGAEAAKLLPPGGIVSARPFVPYFAGRPFVVLPIASPERVLELARRERAAGIALESAQDRKGRPDLAAWLGPVDPPGLRRVYERNLGDDGTWIVYALEPAP